MRRERPSEILTLLRLTRVGVLLVVTGAVLTLAFGTALASHLGYGMTPAWIRVALALWLASVVLGAIGGRAPPPARYPAEGGAGGGGEAGEGVEALGPPPPPPPPPHPHRLPFLPPPLLLG